MPSESNDGNDGNKKGNVAAQFIAPQAGPREDRRNELRRHIIFLDWLMSESERYARRLGERLKERVFEEIFPHFARGFIISARRAGQLPADLEDLPDSERNRLLEPFFNGTLTFLYRLLFLLYAESRDLLPVREERGYYPRSLETLKHADCRKSR